MLTIVQMFPLDTYAAISFSSWMQSSAPCTTVASSSGHPLDPGGWGWGVTGRGSLHGVGSRLRPIPSLGRGVTASRTASPEAGEPREQSERCQCHLRPQPPGAPWVCCFGWPDTKRSVSRSVFQISFHRLTFRGGELSAEWVTVLATRAWLRSGLERLAEVLWSMNAVSTPPIFGNKQDAPEACTYKYHVSLSWYVLDVL